ncbi:MAG TPA: MBL fold metallo-hydrolase [Anaerolineae bacterium]|nr:MBL fold metallo-hydrolase [Anaerolineae bacterium]
MRIKFLGTGAAEGIPAINCACFHCRKAREEGGRLVRERSAILFSLPGYELLVDTPPGILNMLAEHGATRIDGIFLTHEHFDHAGGLEEFFYWKADVDLFAAKETYRALRKEEWGDKLGEIAFHILYRPGMITRFNDFFLVPFLVLHSVPTYGLMLREGKKKIVYTSDSALRFSNHARCLMAGADLLIVNTPYFINPPHEAHIGVPDAIELKGQVGARRLILTHFNHYNRPHDELEEYVRQFEGVEVAYDGMEVEV